MKGYVGRVVLVAGAAHGLGRGTALRLLDLGAEVVALDCDERGLVALSTSASNDRLHCATLAFTDSAAVEAVITRVMATWRPDALINAASLNIKPGQPLLEQKIREHFSLLRSVARQMADSRKGALLTLADERAAAPAIGIGHDLSRTSPLALMVSCFELTLSPLGIPCALLPLEPDAPTAAEHVCRTLTALLSRPRGWTRDAVLR